MDYSHDRQLLATGSTDHMIHLIPLTGLLASPPNAHSLNDHTKAVTGVKFADDGRKLLSCGADQQVVFRDIKAPKTLVETGRCNVANGTLHDMAIQRSGKFVVTCGADKQLRVWNAATGKAARSYPVCIHYYPPLPLERPVSHVAYQ
jgi:WD40 repeat protein